MSLTEKIGMLDNLHSGINSNAVGHEFKVNESVVYIFNWMSFNRNTYKARYILIGG